MVANNCRVLKGGKHRITSPYGTRTLNGKKEFHGGVDLVKYYAELDYIIAHTDGVVVDVKDGLGNMKGTNSYGNYVKLSHNGWYTFYAHLHKGVKVKIGDKVTKGTILGFMGNSGNSYGAHLHFEVWRGNYRIDPTPYLTSDLPGEDTKNGDEPHRYKIGDVVNINGVYVSSTSTTKLKPAKTKGKITKIVEARNPYLLENGNIGWVNDDCITSKVEPITYKTVCNCSWLNLRTTPSYGNNIYTSVKSGTKLIYLGESNGWAKVSYKNKTLYCGKSYLK